MTSSELYQSFCDNLAILQEEQPKLLENATVNGYNNKKHTDLLSKGDEMLKNLLKLAKKGSSFIDSLSSDIIPKIIIIINEYINLFKSPNRFYNICKCIKVNRNNISYEKKFIKVKANVIYATYIPTAVVIDTEAENLNVESVRYSEYVTRAIDIFNKLDKLQTKGNNNIKNRCIDDLLHFIDTIDRFILYYFEENENQFRLDGRRKLKQLKELLLPNEDNTTILPRSQDSKTNETNQPVISRRILVKVQSSLQEILNSALALSLTKSKSSIYLIEDYNKLLKTIHDKEIKSFEEIEDEINTYNLMDDLHRLREESEIVYNDSNSKLKESNKRWIAIKKQSIPREVASLTDPVPPPTQQTDPTKIFTSTGKQIGNIGKEGGKFAIEAVTGVKDAVGLVASDVRNLAGTGLNIASTGATKAFSVGGKVITQPAKLLGLDDSPSTNNNQTNQSNGKTNSFTDLKFPKFPNLLDS